MRKPLIALASALALVPFAARGDAPADVLIVNLKSQQSVHFALAEAPTLSFQGDQLSIIPGQSAGEVNYALSEIKDFTFGQLSSANLPTADATFEIIDNVVTMRGVTAGITATVTDSAGRIVLSAKTDGSGSAVMDMRPLPGGVYIICADKITYKYIKRP